jgi:hypothetical protein
MIQEADRVRTLEELKGQTLEELLHEVARNGEKITVVLEEGEAVVIQPAVLLKPLPELEGSIPEGWKDAIYSE